MINVLDFVRRLQLALQGRKNESGFTTAELLGNAALGVLALVAIWYAIGQLGGEVMEFIRAQLLNTQ